MVTKRVHKRQMLLIEDEYVTQVIEYTLAYCMQNYKVDLHAIIVEGNHIHRVDTDVDGVRPDFLPFRRSVLSRVEYVMGRDLSSQVDVAMALDRYDLLVRPSVTYRFAQLVEATLMANWLAGDGTGFFGMHSANSRLGLKLEAKY